MPSFRDTNPFMNYGMIDSVYVVEKDHWHRTYKTYAGALKAAGDTGVIYLARISYEEISREVANATSH